MHCVTQNRPLRVSGLLSDSSEERPSRPEIQKGKNHRYSRAQEKITVTLQTWKVVQSSLGSGLETMGGWGGHTRHENVEASPTQRRISPNIKRELRKTEMM